MKRLLSLALGCALAGGAWGAHEQAPALKTEQDRMTYSLGYQIGQDFKRQGVDVRPQAVSRGVADALAGTAPLLAPDDMRRTLLELKRKIKSREIAEGRKQQAEEHAKDEAFLAENAKKEGVVVLPSGLQYKILKAGSGRQPAPGDQVTVSYRASLTSGVEFDRTPEGQPVSFAVDEVIPGWREGLRRMHEGAHWQLFVPSSLGYGVRGPLANRAVILDVELVEVGANGEATAVQAPSGEPQKK